MTLYLGRPDSRRLRQEPRRPCNWPELAEAFVYLRDLSDTQGFVRTRLTAWADARDLRPIHLPTQDEHQGGLWHLGVGAPLLPIPATRVWLHPVWATPEFRALHRFVLLPRGPFGHTSVKAMRRHWLRLYAMPEARRDWTATYHVAGEGGLVAARRAFRTLLR